MTALRMLPPAHYVGAVESIPAWPSSSSSGCRPPAPPTGVDRGRLLLASTAAPAFGDESGLARERDAADLPRARRRPGAPRASRTPSTRCCGAAPARASRPGPAAVSAPAAPAGTSSARRSRCTTSAATSTSRAAAATWSSRTTRCAPGTPQVAAPGTPVRAGLRPRRHGRARRREDVEVAGQPGLRLPPPQQRRRPDGDPARPAAPPLPRRLGVDRRRALGRRRRPRRLAPRPRPRRRCSPGPVVTEVLAALADDLDAPAPSPPSTPGSAPPSAPTASPTPATRTPLSPYTRCSTLPSASRSDLRYLAPERVQRWCRLVTNRNSGGSGLPLVTKRHTRPAGAQPSS